MIQKRSGTEYDKDGNLLQKELLVKLMLNRSTEKLQPNPNSAPLTEPIVIRGFDSYATELDFDEVIPILTKHLMLCVGQPYRMDRATRERFITHHHQLHINDDNRKQFIMLFSGASYSQLTNPNYYELVLQQVKHYPPNFFASIDKDICRTFHGESPLQGHLRNVLYAYAIRNPRLLYCQGLNYLVAYFLIREYSQHQTFWLLVQLVEEVLPVDYYVDMGAVVGLSSILTDLLQETLHGFIDYCQQIGLETSFFLVPWLICLYTKGFSSSLSNFIMECIVIEKEVALVKTALTLLKIVVPKIQECDDFGAFMKDLQAKVPSISVKDFKFVYDSIYINRYFFRVLLDNYLKEYWQRAEDHSIEAAATNRNALPKCDPSLPVCLHVIQINRRFRNISEVDTFRVGGSMIDLSDESYFDTNRFEGDPIPNCKNGYFKKSTNELMIGRHEHICARELQQKKPEEGQEQQIKADIEKMVRELIEDPEEHEVSVELEDFKEKALRKTNSQRIDTITSIFEVVQDFETESFDAIEVVVEETRESKFGKKDSIVRLPDKVPSSSIREWFKKLF